jgi:hypothetical protein
LRQLLGTITILTLMSCNAKDKSRTEDTSDSFVKKDTTIETTLSDKHQEAQTDIIGTWRIYKDISRDGDKCDSTSIIDGSCGDKNTEMITRVTFSENGKYTLKSGFENNHPSEDNGKWKVSGTKYGIDILLLESLTTKNTVGPSATNLITTYIIQNISYQHLALIDAEMFNIMYFIPDPRNVK